MREERREGSVRSLQPWPAPEGWGWALGIAVGGAVPLPFPAPGFGCLLADRSGNHLGKEVLSAKNGSPKGTAGVAVSP